MAKILVVNPRAEDRNAVRAELTPRGHTIIEAGSAEDALARLGSEQPELVLVEAILPGMHGFEMVRRLKAMPDAANSLVPVIMLSDLRDPSSRVLALRSGADDFLSKPFDPIELSARVGRLIERREERQAFARQSAELLALHRFREEMTELLVHDLKTPLTVVLSNVEILMEDLSDAGEPVTEALEQTRSAVLRARRMVSNLRDVPRMEERRFELRRERFDARRLLADSAEIGQAVARVRKVDLTVALGPPVEVDADRDVVTRIVDNVLDNALRYTPVEGRIVLGADAAGGHVELRIGNSGRAIAEGDRARIFDKGRRVEGEARENLGLGLYFCRIAAEAHGGRIRIEDAPELPTVFVLELPA